MTTSKMLAIDGYRLCFTQHNGTPVVRYEDCMLAFGLRPENIHGRRWESCASRMTEGVHWFRLENPFTRQIEPFLTIAGLGITAVGHCRDEVLQKRITQSMAEAWEREVLGETKLPARKYEDDPTMAFLSGVLDSIAQTRADIRRIDNTLASVQQEVRDQITARRFCADNGIPAGRRDENIIRLGQRATHVCISEGIKYLPKARQDGDFPANAYPRDVLARAAREIGLMH